jgi:hypothetical protein
VLELDIRGPSADEGEGLKELLEAMISYMEEFDEIPKVAGMRITPAYLATVYGYLGSGITVISVQFSNFFKQQGGLKGLLQVVEPS